MHMWPRLKYLSRFYNQATSKAWRCRKFKEELKHDLKKIVAPVCINEFPTLVEKEKMIEKLEQHPTRVMRLHHSGSLSGSFGGRNIAHQ